MANQMLLRERKEIIDYDIWNQLANSIFIELDRVLSLLGVTAEQMRGERAVMRDDTVNTPSEVLVDLAYKI